MLLNDLRIFVFSTSFVAHFHDSSCSLSFNWTGNETGGRLTSGLRGFSCSSAPPAPQLLLHQQLLVAEELASLSAVSEVAIHTKARGDRVNTGVSVCSPGWGGHSALLEGV